MRLWLLRDTSLAPGASKTSGPAQNAAPSAMAETTDHVCSFSSSMKDMVVLSSAEVRSILDSISTSKLDDLM